MFDAIFDRKPHESDAQYILRLYMDPWFEDSTPKELADFTGLPSAKVSRVLFAWAKSTKIRRIHSHATAVAEQIGWSGTPEGLVHTALELFKQRADKREAVPPGNIDDQIQDFLARHRVPSECHVSSSQSEPAARAPSDDTSGTPGGGSEGSAQA